MKIGKEDALRIVGIILVVFGVGYCVYVTFWIYPDRSLYMLTVREQFTSFWPGYVSLIIGSVLCKIDL